MPSVLSISNSALTKIGAKNIVSFNDPNKEARLCALHYEECRDVVLRAHPWNCATDRVLLAPLSAVPAFGCSKQFQIPIRCLRILLVNEDPDTEYTIEGRNILCECDQLKLKFITKVEDTNILDVSTAEAISCYLAWQISFALTQSDEIRDMMWKAYTNTMRQSKTVDAQENATESIQAEYLIESRTLPTDSNVPKRNW